MTFAAAHNRRVRLGDNVSVRPNMEHADNADAPGVPDAAHTGPAAARPQGVPVTARGLTHTYRSAEGRLRVLNQLDLVVASGGYASIRGPSGAGKSTLLSLLGGLGPPQEGDVLVGDINLSGLAGDELAEYRRSTVGFVFQHFGLL